MAIVYRHRRCDDNSIFYIGIGAERSRALSKDGRNRHWRNIANKHGFVAEITHDDICWEEACVIEKYLIEFYGRRDLGKGGLVNMTDGGDGVFGMKQSERCKITSSATHKGVPKPEHVRKKISESNRGKRVSEESRRKMSLAKKGKKAPHVSELNKKRVGELHRMFGKKHSEDTKRKIGIKSKMRCGENACKGIRVIDTYTGIEYKTMKLASISTGYDYPKLKKNIKRGTDKRFKACR